MTEHNFTRYIELKQQMADNERALLHAGFEADRFMEPILQLIDWLERYVIAPHCLDLIINWVYNKQGPKGVKTVKQLYEHIKKQDGFMCN